MYEEIPPELKIKSTLNHPARPEEVIGFAGRNTKLGREAVIMKSDAIDGNKVVVPTGASQGLINGEGELVVLNGNEVLTMTGADFALEYALYEVQGRVRGESLMMNTVNLNSEKFRSWHQSNVEVGN